MNDLSRRAAVAAGLGTAAAALTANAAVAAPTPHDSHGGHTITYGEVRFDGTNPSIVNDSGDFTVEYNDVQFTFTLKFQRDISTTVISLTPFFGYVGDQPFLSIHAARKAEDPRSLGVAISRADEPFAKAGCGFWIKIMYLSQCAE